MALAGCTGAPTNDGQSGSDPSTADHQETDEHHDQGGDHHEETSSDDHEEAGHAEEEHGHGSIGDPTPTAEVAVNTTENGEAHFSPHVTRLERGGTLTWVLESGSHTATAYHPANDEPQLAPDGADAWDSGMLSEDGETFRHTFDTEGVYHYFCRPHEAGGMIGSVIVGDPDPHDQPALESPPAGKPAHVREKIEELNQQCTDALGGDH